MDILKPAVFAWVTIAVEIASLFEDALLFAFAYSSPLLTNAMGVAGIAFLVYGIVFIIRSTKRRYGWSIEVAAWLAVSELAFAIIWGVFGPPAEAHASTIMMISYPLMLGSIVLSAVYLKEAS